MGDYPAVRTQLDNDRVQPLHAWLAKYFTFCDHHFGIGSNSTSGHLLSIGGQTPTLKNPPFGPGAPDLGHAIDLRCTPSGPEISWAAIPDGDGYPRQVLRRARHRGSCREHPSDASAPTMRSSARRRRQPAAAHVRVGACRRRRAPAVPGLGSRVPGHALTTCCGADRRGRASRAVGNDNVHPRLRRLGRLRGPLTTPVVETVPDILHPDGFPIIGGSRLPLLCSAAMCARQSTTPGTRTPASPRRSSISSACRRSASPVSTQPRRLHVSSAHRFGAESRRRSEPASLNRSHRRPARCPKPRLHGRARPTNLLRRLSSMEARRFPRHTTPWSERHRRSCRSKHPPQPESSRPIRAAAYRVQEKGPNELGPIGSVTARR